MLIQNLSTYICYPQVGSNKADLGLGPFSCTQARSTVVLCSHAIKHTTTHWMTRAPQPLPPVTNILRIYSTDCWFLTFISMFIVSIFLVVAAKLGTHYGVGTDDFVDVALVPFR